MASKAIVVRDAQLLVTVNSSDGDTWQTGITWLPLSTLLDEPLWPRVLAPWLLAPPSDRPAYLGNVN